jgi:protein arginine kinase
VNLRDLAHQSGEWLKGSGPMSEVVISSRIRLARNLAGFPFLTRADAAQREEIQRLISDAFRRTQGEAKFFFIDIEKADDLDRQVLVERHLISRQHADARGSRGVAVSAAETLAMMINEEDHLRMQAYRSGFQLDDAWEELNQIDDALSQELEFAFHPQYGYLTACPTNVGTGIRVSVMLHLPALKLTGEIERVFRAANDLKLAVRGLYGEHTEAAGDFYQISNQTTLGKSEQEFIDEFKHEVIPKIIEYELQARQTLLKEKPSALDDKVHRAFGLLGSARVMSSEETLFLLSHLRMGIHLGRIKGIDMGTVNELFIRTQPAHLQKLEGRVLDGEQRSVARAEYIRRRLGGNGLNN